MKAVDKFLLRSLFPLCLAASFAACQKVDLPVEEGGDKTSSGQTGNKPGNNGPNLGEGDSQTALTVAKLKEKYKGVNLEEEDYGEWVAGYIVGAVNGSSISKALFAIDEIVEAGIKSNLLIADTKGDTVVSHCVPVELKRNTEEREKANLADNPDNFGCKIVVFGLVKDYFRRVGLKSVEYCELLDNEDEQDPNHDPVEPTPEPAPNPDPDPKPNPNPEPEPEPAPEPEPEPEPNPDPERKDTIRVDTVPGHIEGGRSNKNNW